MADVLAPIADEQDVVALMRAEFMEVHGGAQLRAGARITMQITWAASEEIACETRVIRTKRRKPRRLAAQVA